MVLARGHRLRRIECITIGTAQDIRRDHELVAADPGVAPNFIRIYVDELDDQVDIRAARCGDEIGHRFAADLQSLATTPM